MALPLKKESFDIVISNLAYQWVQDLEKAFALLHTVLRGEGELHMTLFGYSTFEELFVSLGQAVKDKGGQNNFVFKRLPDQQQVCQAIKKAGFRDVDIDYEKIKVRFADMMSLLQWIKNIGANAFGGQAFIGKEFLLRANEYYDQHFKDKLGIYSTFEVIWVKAKK